MKKRNKDFVNTGLSFEDFELSLTKPDTHEKTLTEIMEENSAAEKSAKKKEAELKRRSSVIKGRPNKKCELNFVKLTGYN